MTDVVIWHNPRCSKSRQTLALLEERGVTPTVIRYLESPPSPAELRDALEALGLSPRELMRKKEPQYRDLDIEHGGFTHAEEVDLMCAHPALIERPVVLYGGRAVLGRPPSNVLQIFED